MKGFVVEGHKGKNEFMLISLSPGGIITIQDYSHGDERYKLIEELEKLGIEISEIIFDSPCG